MKEINKEAFAANRRRLFELMPDNSLALLKAAPQQFRSGDTTYPYSQDRNFYYLTGYENREATLLLKKSGKNLQAYLFVVQLTPLQIHWLGYLPGPDEVKELTGIQHTGPLKDLNKTLMRLLQDVDTFFLDFTPLAPGEPLTPSHQLAEAIRKANPHLRIQRLEPVLSMLREIKVDWEQVKIAEAINLTKSGITRMLKHLEPGIREFEMDAWFKLDLNLQRSCPAFPTIVAGGNNATILHYIDMHDSLSDGDLVLFDLGAEFENYSADISRTFPISGTFTPEQKALYNVVLEANIAAINAVATGVTVSYLNTVTRDTLAAGMKRLGYISDESQISKYFTHSVTHSLGLDTHDSHSPGFATLKPGMVLTIEPGIYIPEKQIGIRIEDDVVVTIDGYNNLSSHIPKTADDVEKWMKEAKK